MAVTKLGKELRKIRIDHEINRKQMAYKIGITDKLLSEIESGKTDMPIAVMNEVSDVYLDLNRSVSFKGTCYDSMNELILDISLMNSEEKQWLVTSIDTVRLTVSERLEGEVEVRRKARADKAEVRKRIKEEKGSASAGELEELTG